jgi:hypothetical protein
MFDAMAPTLLCREEEHVDSPQVGKSKYLAQEVENPFAETETGDSSNSSGAAAGGRKSKKKAAHDPWDSVTLDSPK